MSVASEFAVIDRISESELPTRAVDAFALSIIKMERQLRRLFTYLIFQSEAFGLQDIEALRGVLSANGNVYFDGFEQGIDALCHTSVAQLVGPDYDVLRPVLRDAGLVRNKIFHGQLTDKCLQREDLAEFSNDIRRWCELLARNAQLELGYDGFARHSFRKGPAALARGYRIQLNSLEDYRDFLARHVQRQPRRAL